ncbi:hypothetical protein CFAM422_005838 [Trichoderma lentiforme]|uniref:Uncharacterized protein n=1 Tax=Trichoderma lentiforme TaxID=1567552 RepID=A0A9P4XGM5_9HYPO|nr:hypothetical protein CFAM422_005838 [Trichoderma lentiforme]
MRKVESKRQIAQSRPPPTSIYARSGSPYRQDDYEIHDRGHGQVQSFFDLRQARTPVPDLSSAGRANEWNGRPYEFTPEKLPREQLIKSQIHCAEDGKEMDFNCSKINIKGLVEEVDRHSRQLQKAADLSE